MEEICYIVTKLQAGRTKSQDATTTTTTTTTTAAAAAAAAAAALPYYTSINAQALLGKVHLITGHGGPDRE